VVKILTIHYKLVLFSLAGAFRYQYEGGSSMKKILLACAVLLSAAANPAKADWIAAAANGHGFGYSGYGYDYEEDARSAAIEDCENRTGRSCHPSRSTSVPIGWDLVVVSCPGGQLRTGGSQRGIRAAIQVASQKAGYNFCNLYANY
jgi:opacity protein-like surface antigen